MKSFKVQNQSGEEFEVDEQNIADAERDGYLPVVSNGQDTHRVSHADLHMAAKDGYEPVGNEPGLLKTAMGKLASGASLGFVDELAGGLEAGGRAIGLKGLGGKLNEIGLSEEGPTMDYDTLSAAYKNARDAERQSQSFMSKANPVTSGISEITGSIATFPATGAASLAGRVGTAAGFGAISGLGTSNEESLTGMAKDAAVGGVLAGGMQYGGEKVIGSIKSLFADNKPFKALGKTAAGISPENTERYLARSKQVNAAPELEDVGRYFKDEAIPKLQEHISKLDNEAWNALSTDPSLAKQDVLQIGQDYVNKMLQGRGGKLSRNAGTGADADKIKAIYEQLDEVQNAFGSHMSEADLKSVVQNMQKLGWSLEGSPRTSLQGQALQELSGVYNELLKGGNQAYEVAMKPVAEAVTTLQSLKRHLINQQAPEELNRFLGTAKRFGMQSENKAALNAIQKADQLTGLGLEDRIKDSVTQNAFNRTDTNGSRKTLAGALIGKAAEGAIGGAIGYGVSDGSGTGAAIGAMAGMGADKYAGQIFKQVLNTKLAAGEGLAKIAPYLGKFAKPLMDAAVRGASAVSATHYILQQQNPEYRAMMQKLNPE
ncbi:MAG: hypothetical protein JNM39_18625 [Bdellovibrionaceae bacterium]|nr:hypothetical protein [Pseudobdellovibrionaceae bacterium]